MLVWILGGPAHGVVPVQVNYDVWGGNVMGHDRSHYEVDRHDFVKLGSANRTAFFPGQYNFYVVAVRKTE